MNEKLAYQASVLFSALAVVLLVLNVTLVSVNRSKQNDIAQRQSTIVSGQSLAQLNQGLIRAIAETSLKNNDLQLRDLLASQGISLKNDQSTKK